jgi:hypothetical protein
MDRVLRIIAMSKKSSYKFDADDLMKELKK